MARQSGKMITLATMCFALFMAMLDNTVVYLALPAIQTSLNAGVSGLQWIVDAYTLVFASLLLTGGTLGDNFGHKRVFQSGLVIFTAGSALCGLAPTTGALIVGRVLQGLGAAGLLPCSLAILTRTFPNTAERAQAIGIWSAVSGLALVVGPALGGLLITSFGWHSAFLLNVPIGLAAFILTSLVVTETLDRERRPVDIVGQVLAVTWLGSLTYALIEANHLGWNSPVIRGMFVLAGVTFLLFLTVEWRSRSALFPLGLFSNPTFAAGNAVAFLVSFGLFSMFFVLSLYLQQVQGRSAAEAGVQFLPVTFSMILTAPLAGHVAGRLGSRLPMATGMALAGISLLLFLRLQVDTPFRAWWWIELLMGIGIGATMAPTTAAVVNSVPEARAGMASATVTTSREIGGTFGIAVLGTVVTTRFQQVLVDRLQALGLSEVVQRRVAEVWLRGGRITDILLPGSDATAVEQAVGQAFVDGMHRGLVVGGAALLLGALVSLVFVRQTLAAASGAPGESARVASPSHRLPNR